MITCVIVDDQQRNISVLKKLLTRYCPDVRITGEAISGAAALEVIRKEQPQLVFLDVEMPGMDAFELLAQLPQFDFEYILVTAFNGYAVKAFENNALHYLLKPVDVDALRLAVQKAATRIMEKNVHRRIAPSGNQSSGMQVPKLSLPTSNGLIFVTVDDIVCCEARSNYTLFEFVKDKQLLVNGTLKTYEEKLPASIFCRVHHSYLVNLNHISQYIKSNGGQLKMVNGQLIDISERKREEFLSRFK